MTSAAYIALETRDIYYESVRQQLPLDWEAQKRLLSIA